MDVDLLSLCSTREVYARVRPHVSEKSLSNEALTILNTIDGWYKDHPLFGEFKWTELETYFFVTRAHTISTDLYGVFKEIFKNLAAYKSTSSQEELMNYYINQEYAARITEALVKVREESATISDIGSLVDAYDKEIKRTSDDVFVDDDVSSMLSTVSSPGLKWRLNELNISLGPLRQGDFVIVSARPEVGKTTFLADNVSYMAEQIVDERPVLWINNEERSDKVKWRVIQSTLGITTKDMEADLPACVKKYQAIMRKENRILIPRSDSGFNSVKSIERLLVNTNPCLIIFDQLDKVVGFGGGRDEREDLRLGRVYQWAREVAHRYGPVIAASQADASAQGMQWLDMDKLRGSKTDKPGEADAIITIGVDPEQPTKRFINIPKNKLHGGPISDERERHGKWEVTIRPDIARYVGVK